MTDYTTIGFNFKRLQILKDALNFRLKDHLSKLATPETSDDERSEINNDLPILENLLNEVLEKCNEA